MRVSVAKIAAAIAGAAVMAAAVLAGTAWYHQSAVQAPLVRAVSRVGGLSQARITPHGHGVIVSLKPGANLAHVYPAVEAAARSATGHPVAVTVEDHPTQAERALMAQMRFVVATGEATGQYITMQQALERQAQAGHLRLAVAMGSAHLYVTLTDASAHRLLQVIDLPKEGGAHAQP